MATSTVPMGTGALQEVQLTLNTNLVAIRDWGRIIARKTANLLIINAHGLYTLTPIGNETAVATLNGVSVPVTLSAPAKVDAQDDSGIAAVGGNTLRLINVRNADKAIYFTLVVPLS